MNPPSYTDTELSNAFNTIPSSRVKDQIKSQNTLELDMKLNRLEEELNDREDES